MIVSKARLFWVVLACAVAFVIAVFRFGTPPPAAADRAAASEPAYEADGWPQQLRGRTLKQSEAGRIYR